MSRALVILRDEEDRRKVARWATGSPDGTLVEFKGPKRSLEANAKMWCLLSEVSDQVVWYGQKLSPPDWKDMFTASLRKARVLPGIDCGSFVALGLRTSDMSKEEMSNLIELIYAFGAERGVVFKDSPSAPAISPTVRAGSEASAQAEETPSAVTRPADPTPASATNTDSEESEEPLPLPIPQKAPEPSPGRSSPQDDALREEDVDTLASAVADLSEEQFAVYDRVLGGLKRIRTQKHRDAFDDAYWREMEPVVRTMPAPVVKFLDLAITRTFGWVGP